MELPSDAPQVPHVYEPLHGPEHIRILILEPALSVDADICITFEQDTYSRLSARYEAISYTWGESHLSKPVHIADGSHILATENLDDALRKLRHSHEKRALWADAICINQNDESEKSVQIPLMVKIFRGASRVLAWLGPATDDRAVRLGMRLLQYWSRQGQSSEFQRFIEDSDHERREEIVSDLQHIVRFLNLPWFSRLWVVQEVVFNLDVVLLYGALEVSWVRVMIALPNILTRIGYKLPLDNLQKLDALQRMARLWREHCGVNVAWIEHTETRPTVSTKHASILDIMEEFSQYDCTDPRDRIFALYSMTGDIRPHPIGAQGSRNETVIFMNVDYSLDVRQTYQAFAYACITKGRLIPILNAVLARQFAQIPDDWPSWVPDWRQRPLPDVAISASGVKVLRQPNPNRLRLLLQCPWIDAHTRTPTHVGQFPIVEPDLVEGRAAAQRLLTSLVDLYSGAYGKLDDIPSNYSSRDLAIMMIELWPAMQILDGELLVSCLTRLWNHEDARYTDFLMNQDRRLARQITEALRNQCFFSATYPGKEVTFLGIGNSAIQPGDRIAPIWTNRTFEIHEIKQHTALILRPVQQLPATNARGKSEWAYRLIGSAHVFPPMYGKRLFHSDRNDTQRLPKEVILI
ncbi:hypothetical protein ACN47E_003392 [Coniothyrium glycines]